MKAMLSLFAAILSASPAAAQNMHEQYSTPFFDCDPHCFEWPRYCSLTLPAEDRSWHLLPQSCGGTVSIVKDLTKHECDTTASNLTPRFSMTNIVIQVEPGDIAGPMSYEEAEHMAHAPENYSLGVYGVIRHK